MISLRVSSLRILGIFLLLGSGCVVFRPVGDVITDGYENTVAYFNSYYNAKNIFDAAEDEVVANEKTVRARDGISDRPIPIPQGARAKLVTVIDKCSNILSFHPGSAYVDDAVFLIGKSYFYQADYLKAERKFAELLALNLPPDFALEARLWLVRTMESLNEDERALAETGRLIADAKEQGEEEIAGKASFVAGALYSKAENHVEAVASYLEATRTSDDEIISAIAQYRIGEEYMSMKSYRDAAEAFLKVAEFTQEEGPLLSSRFKAIAAFREAGEHERALAVSGEAKDDYRFVNALQSVEYEEALTLKAKGEVQSAQAILTAIDTTSPKTVLGCKAAFELARMYEEGGDYRKAHEEYIRAAAFPVPEIYTRAQERQRALARYHALVAERAKRDSLMARLEEGTADSSFGETAYDSLVTLQAENAYELGEVFYADMELPDSAGFWYRKALAMFQDSVKAPRILYVLAEMHQSSSETRQMTPEQLYDQIIVQYPKSQYAARARVRLGLEVESPVIDSAGFVYQRAERTIEQGKYETAIVELKSIVDAYPFSPFAAKSAYAVGWLYEHRLDKPDSALAQYNSLLEHFSDTPYASLLRKRLKPVSAAAPADTVRETRMPPDELPQKGAPKNDSAPRPPVKIIE